MIKNKQTIRNKAYWVCFNIMNVWLLCLVQFQISALIKLVSSEGFLT